MKRMSFASLVWKSKNKVTGGERVLGEMVAVIPCKDLNALIEPHYPKAGKGAQPMPEV